MFVRNFVKIRQTLKIAPVGLFSNLLKSECGMNTVNTLFKRNASIHTRHILIQKARLEHVSNFGVFLLLFPVTTFGLGVWQIKRKIWKEQLIANLKSQMSKDPVDLPEDLTQLNSMEYQPVRVRGHFVHDQEIYIGPRSLIETEEEQKKGILTIKPKSGYLVITPFQLEGREERILINRGWVPKEKKNPALRKGGQIESVIEITGVVRKHENRPQFMPKMRDQKLFLFRDVERMSKILETEPYYLDANVQSSIPGGPIGGQTTISLRNEHLSYVATWFSLSGLSCYFWYKIVYLAPK